MNKPSLEEIEQYFIERQHFNQDSPEAFYDHFESNGWKVGRNPMKNWQAAIRTWIRNDKKWGRTNESNNRTTAKQGFAEQQQESAIRAYREMEYRNRENYPRLVHSNG